MIRTIIFNRIISTKRTIKRNRINQYGRTERALISQSIFYIVSRFLLRTHFLDIQQLTYIIHRSLQLKCIKICLLLSLTYATLYQCCVYFHAPASARLDTRCRDSDRYNLSSSLLNIACSSTIFSILVLLLLVFILSVFLPLILSFSAPIANFRNL